MFTYQTTFSKGMTPTTRSNGLLRAIERDNYEEVEQILHENDFSLSDLSLALHSAASIGNEHCVKLLLEHKSMPNVGANIHDSSGLTPLIIASKKGHEGVVRELLKAGCKLDKATFRIRATALHWAAAHGQYGCVCQLIRAGAKLNCMTANGRTPLMMAARAGHADIVSKLIGGGADIKCTDFERMTALHLAAGDGNTECARVLVRHGADVNQVNKHGFTPFILAARKGHADTLEMFLRRCPFELKLDKKCRQMNALHWAAEGGDADCVMVLLKNEMDPNSVTLKSHVDSQYVILGRTSSLMIAAKKGHLAVCNALLQFGAKTDLVDDEGFTALLYAVKFNHAEIARMLIDSGDNPNGVEPETHTDQTESAQSDGSHFQFAAANDSDSEQNGDDAIQASIAQIEVNEEDADIEELEGFEADDSTVTSPVLLAVDREHIEVLKVLLRANCDINVVGLSSSGPMTPLELALWHGNVEMCKMLIAAGSSASFCIANAPLMEETMADLCEKDPAFFEMLVSFLSSPPSLMRSCRKKIRDAIGLRAHSKVTVLPLPVVLQRYVNLSELDDSQY